MTLSLEKCPGLACGTGGDKRAKGNETSRNSGTDRMAAREARRPQEGWWPASWHQEGASGQLRSQAWVLWLIVVLTCARFCVVPSDLGQRGTGFAPAWCLSEETECVSSSDCSPVSPLLWDRKKSRQNGLCSWELSGCLCAGAQGCEARVAPPSIRLSCAASSQNLAYEIILTLGQAFEVAYQLALQAQKSRPMGASAAETIETKSSKPVPKPRVATRKSAVRGPSRDSPRPGLTVGGHFRQLPLRKLPCPSGSCPESSPGLQDPPTWRGQLATLVGVLLGRLARPRPPRAAERRRRTP